MSDGQRNLMLSVSGPPTTERHLMASRSYRKLTRCPRSGKLRYRDQPEAINALHHAVTARHRAEVDGVETGHRECRAYACPACRGWHLTSQAVWGAVAA